MNFDSETPVDVLMGQLLAFVIMFEKRIEHLKCRLAGNEQFHTRLAFQALDPQQKNQIYPNTLAAVLQSTSSGDQQSLCQLFFRKYSKHGVLTYDEFLKLVTPKGNKTLAQRMLVRSFRRGALLEDYLYRHLIELLVLYVKMTSVTESLRATIQHNEDLSHLDLIEFFHQRIVDSQSLLLFLARSNQQGEQYDLQSSDADYLSYHVKSGNDLDDFTDMDIKELICPLDMNFQKPITRQTFFQHTSYPRETQVPFNQTQTVNFLSKTYQKIYDKKGPMTKKENVEELSIRPDKYQIANTNRQLSGMDKHRGQDHGYSNLYIDNFARSQVDSELQINNFLANNMFSKRQVQVFQDELNSNASSISKKSRESAFERT